jgi:hypothetical protein
MDELVAALVALAGGGEQTVHGPRGAIILAFVEQSGADRDGGVVLEPGAVQMGKHGVAFGLREAAGGPWAGGSRAGDETADGPL